MKFPYSIYMEGCHQILHEMDQDFDNTVFVSLTEKDSVTVALAMATLTIIYPCLGDVSEELQLRLKEILYVQKPEWMVQDAGNE